MLSVEVILTDRWPTERRRTNHKENNRPRRKMANKKKSSSRLSPRSLSLRENPCAIFELNNSSTAARIFEDIGNRHTLMSFDWDRWDVISLCLDEIYKEPSWDGSSFPFRKHCVSMLYCFSRGILVSGLVWSLWRKQS